jgi:hypothetical protein
MRAKEFLSESDGSRNVTINIPITITIPAGGGDPVVGAGSVAAPATPGRDLPHEPLMISPLQQELELLKQQGGKRSKIINQIVTDNGAHSDDDEELKENKEYDINEDFDKLDAEFQQLIEAQKG